MNVIPTPIEGLLVIEPTVFGDDRGFFYESFNARRFEELTGVRTQFVQDNHSRSSKGVLRGLHYQIEQAQGKLVRVTTGAVFDVAVGREQAPVVDPGRLRPRLRGHQRGGGIPVQDH